MTRNALIFASFILVFTFACAPGPGAGKSKDVKTPHKKALGKKGKDKGRLLIGVYECLSCHSLNGQGAKDGVCLDNLDRSREFLIEHILDPETHVERNPKSYGNQPNVMPSYQLSRKEAADIADYLIALRREKHAAKKTRDK
jgi:Cytochrome c.